MKGILTMKTPQFDKKKFGIDSYGNLYPKKKSRPIYFKRLRKSPQPAGNTVVANATNSL